MIEATLTVEDAITNLIDIVVGTTDIGIEERHPTPGPFVPLAMRPAVVLFLYLCFYFDQDLSLLASFRYIINPDTMAASDSSDGSEPFDQS